MGGLRSREVRADFWRDERLGSLTRDDRLVWVGLFAAADREGRLEDRPVFLRALLFPYDADLDVGRSLAGLAALGLVRRYVVEGVACIEIADFGKWQRVHPHERASVLPAPVSRDVITSPDIPGNVRECLSEPSGPSGPSGPSEGSGLSGVGSSREVGRRKKSAVDPRAPAVLAEINRLSGRRFEATERQLRSCSRILDNARAVAPPGADLLDFVLAVLRHRSANVSGERDRFFFRPATFAVPGNFENYAEELASGIRSGPVRPSRVEALEASAREAHRAGCERFGKGGAGADDRVLRLFGDAARH